MSQKITECTSLNELQMRPEWESLIPYLVYSQNGLGGNLKMNMSLADIEKMHKTWSAKDMAYGLNRVAEILESGEKFAYPVYDAASVAEDTEKGDVQIFHFPAESKQYVILAAGGGYGSVCSLPESFPVAAKLNELGVTVFCLNYRVGAPKVFPKPMQDLAAACKYIEAHADDFQVNAEEYAVGGFSAGGHLAASWGTKSIGYEVYGCLKPKCMLLDYPLIDVWDTLQQMPLPVRIMMVKGSFGNGNAEEICKDYESVRNMDADYPPSFLIQAENDSTVPISNSDNMKNQLAALGIAYEYERIKTGEHGFGLGTSTEAEGWGERALRFWKHL